jgi:two-component SAPR family response regulator
MRSCFHGISHEEVVITTPTHIAFDSRSVEVDSRIFENKVAAIHRGKTIDDTDILPLLVLGEETLMSNVSASWIEPYRLAHQRNYQSLVLWFISHKTASGEPLEAIHWATRLCATNPLGEEPRLALMKVFASESRYDDIKTEFNSYSRLVQHELGTGVSIHFQRSYEALLAQATSAVVYPTSTESLLPELVKLREDLTSLIGSLDKIVSPELGSC